MSDTQARRMGAATGIIFVLLIAIGLFAVVPKAPAFDSSAASIRQFYIHNRHDLQVGLFIASFGFLFFVWFLGSLVSHLRSFEGQERRLTAIVFGSGLLVIGDFIVALGVFGAAALRPDQTSAEVVRMLNDFGFLLAVPAALVATAFFAAIAILSFRTGALPGWLSGLAVLAAIGSAFAVGGFFSDSGAFNAGDGGLGFYVPFISFLLWILLASVVLTARTAVERPAGALG